MRNTITHLEAGKSFGDLPPVGKGSLLGAGLGVGALAALVLCLKYFIRPPTKERIPETISPVKFTTHAFQSSRGQMIYHESGTGPGPTLVFIHNVGVGASSYEWSKVYTSFAENHRVLAPDLLGFGESERPRAKLTATDHAESLAEFLSSLCADEAQRPVIVARGLGGGFAALMAALHPDVAGRLLLWMPSGRATVPGLLNLASRVPNLNSFIYRNKLARRATIRARFGAKGAFVNPGLVTQEMVEVHAICAQQYQADYAIYRLFQGKLSFDLDSRFPEIPTPATLLYPSLSSAAALAVARRLQASNPGSNLRVVEGTGPFAPLESPDGVIDVLCDELRGERRAAAATG